MKLRVVPANQILCTLCANGDMFLKGGPFGDYYQCNVASCDARQALDHDGKPRGIAAGPATRKARRNAHEVFDRLWKGTSLKSKFAYYWLSKQIGTEYRNTHVGYFDEATCLRVIEVCRSTTTQHILDWLSARASERQQCQTTSEETNTSKL